MSTLFASSGPVTIEDNSNFTVTNAADNSSAPANCSDGQLQVSVAGGSTSISLLLGVINLEYSTSYKYK